MYLWKAYKRIAVATSKPNGKWPLNLKDLGHTDMSLDDLLIVQVDQEGMPKSTINYPHSSPFLKQVSNLLRADQNAAVARLAL